MQNSRNKQIGGSHYKEMLIQPVDYIVGNGLGFREGCAIKYISRHDKKGGVADLRKAIHFIEMIIEDYENVTRIKEDEDKEQLLYSHSPDWSLHVSQGA